MSPDTKLMIERLLFAARSKARKAGNDEAVAITSLVAAKERRVQADTTVKELEELLK